MGWRDLFGRFNTEGSVPEVNNGDVLVAIPKLRPPTIQELVQRYVRESVSRQAVADGMESFDEADDFEEDDPDVIPMTHHEVAALTDDELRGVASGYGLELRDDRPARRVAPQEGKPPKTPLEAAGGEPE